MAEPESEPEAAEPSGVEVRAPIVGTFYRAASPDATPFVAVGDRINQGDVRGIVEAMKLMNEIAAAVSGKVKDVLVENGILEEGV